MKIDENRHEMADSDSNGDRQNRREFFNGLGKWSMVVVAAVSLLRGSITQVHAGLGGKQRPEWKPPETDFPQLAKKPPPWKQYVKSGTGHYDAPHVDVPHADQNIMMKPGGGNPSGQPPKIYDESR